MNISPSKNQYAFTGLVIMNCGSCKCDFIGLAIISFAYEIQYSQIRAHKVHVKSAALFVPSVVF